MALAIGTQLGTHEITALLGKGGMGEVYRARDLKLKREVAIKVLPDEFSRDADRVSRFQREAEVLASLNHTNIAGIYDLAEAAGSRYLVLELVDGETLADRIARGPIPLDEALHIAKSICEALEAAHEKGIIHRDLKPANVKITPDGKVKVLDFGLAKAMDQSSSRPTISNSPTISLAATAAGIILGTAAYMPPEQAKGKTVDNRADVWAFGVVLFEMMTGRMVFAGESAAETMAFVMTKEPEWSALPAGTPPRVRELIRRCLIKDPRRRLQSIGDARIAVEEALADPEPETTFLPAATKQAQSRLARSMPWAVAAVLGVAFAAAVAVLLRTPDPTAPAHVSADLGVEVVLDAGNGTALCLSADGSMLAFVGRPARGRQQLYLRRLDQLKASPLQGTEGARNCFFSPNGQWIAFFADGKLKKISASGGSAVALADAMNGRGGSWGDDQNIVFTPSPSSPLFRIGSAGGTPEQLTKLAKEGNEPAEVTHRWPQMLPGSKAVLFTSSPITGSYRGASIVVQSLLTGERKVLQRGGFYGRYLSSGHLSYVHEGTLFIAPFDLKKLELTGQPVPALDGLSTYSNNGTAQIAFSSTGTAVYVPGTDFTDYYDLAWMARDGKTTPLRSTPGNIWNPRFSPDGRRVAIDLFDKQRNIWIYDWARDTISRLTDGQDDRFAVWNPDGRRVAFQSARSGSSNLFWQRADGTGEVQRLTDSRGQQIPTSFHPSGKFLAFSELNVQSDTSNDIMILPLEGDESAGWKPGKPTVFLGTKSDEMRPMFSPDGHWLAYESNATGRVEVYVRQFPLSAAVARQVSSGGGSFPVWSRTKKELFYRSDDLKLMVVPYTVEGDSFKADKPSLWTDSAVQNRETNWSFDLHPDGQRFGLIGVAPTAGASSDKLIFIFNFFDEVRRLAK
jgi:serine/threonine-protein kinase